MHEKSLPELSCLSASRLVGWLRNCWRAHQVRQRSRIVGMSPGSLVRTLREGPLRERCLRVQVSFALCLFIERLETSVRVRVSAAQSSLTLSNPSDNHETDVALESKCADRSVDRLSARPIHRLIHPSIHRHRSPVRYERVRAHSFLVRLYVCAPLASTQWNWLARELVNLSLIGRRLRRRSIHSVGFAPAQPN